MIYDYDVLRKLLLEFVIDSESGPIPSTDKVTLSPPSGFPLTEETHRHVDRLVAIGILQRTKEIEDRYRGPVPTLRLAADGSVWAWRSLSDEAWDRFLPDLHALVEIPQLDEGE
jgi:hypothetical protein